MHGCRAALLFLTWFINPFSASLKTNVLSAVQTFARILYGVHRFPLELSDGFASVVEKHRQARGLSRSALASQAGLHQTYIGLLERGKRSPNLDTAQAIARSLGCSLSQLIIEAEKIQQKKSESDEPRPASVAASPDCLVFRRTRHHGFCAECFGGSDRSSAVATSTASACGFRSSPAPIQ